jgi:nitronate monooxygenase
VTKYPLRDLISQLPLPAVAAPMTAISTPAVVAAACAAGVVGAFPTSNCRSVTELDEWFDEIDELIRAQSIADLPSGPVAANIIVGKQNARLDEDLACVARRRIPVVITSVGNPAPVIGPLHEAGCLVLVDVASMAHAHKALAAGADGLTLLSAGAGGHTGWANPLAFVRAVRRFYDGPLAVAGGMSDGHALWAAIVAGYDLGMYGTRFIATPESGASPSWREAIVASTMDDVTVASAPNGVSASMLRGGGGSGGHTVSAVDRLMSVREVVAELQIGWQRARAGTAALLGVPATTPMRSEGAQP